MANPPGGGHQDSGLSLKYAEVHIPARHFTGIAADGTSLGVGGQIAELAAASELEGISMATGDDIYTALSLRAYDFDLEQDLQARLLFESTSTDADTGVSWSLAAKGIDVGQVIGDAKVTPDGSVTFADKTMTSTASVLTATEWASLSVAGELGALDANNEDFIADALVALAVTLTSSGTASADELKLVAVELRGHRKITSLSGRQST